MLIGIDASRVTRPQRTGTENYSLQVLRHLLAEPDDNLYRLYLSAPLSPDVLPLSSRVSTRLIALPRLWTHLGLSSEMVRAAPDVLFVPSHVLPLIIDTRSVVVIYDVGHRYFPHAHRLTERVYLEWAIRRHVRCATRLLTISESAKNDLVRLYRADPDRISVAYPAVDARYRPASESEVARVRRTYDLGPEYILHVGTIKPRKNLPRLVQAFARADLPATTRLVLTGMTTYGAGPVEHAIAEAGLGDRVRRLAYVPDADLPALYSGAAGVAIVSLYEGFGMPALEALACGAPVVVSRWGSLPEIVGGGGVLVDPLEVDSIAGGLEHIVAEPPDRATGPRRASEFTWAQAAAVTRASLEAAGAPDAGRHLRSHAPSRPS